MRFRLILYVLCAISYVQGQVVDDFSDGDFTNNPVWEGNEVDFEVDGTFKLHLNAPAVENQSYLATGSQAINNADWEMLVELDFNPSSQNYADIYLVSDQPDLTNSQNGYFVRIGNSSDEVSLYNLADGSLSEIIDGIDGSVDMSFVSVRIKVTRDNQGNWELFSDPTGGSNFDSEGTIFHDQVISSSYFGVLCNYSPTRSDKFYFDDVIVSGDPFIDDVPPTLTDVEVVNNQLLRLNFNEALDPLSVSPQINYSVNLGIGNPTNVSQPSNHQIDLSFTQSFENGLVYELTVSNVADVSGNEMNPLTEEFFFFFPGIPATGSVLFNELMADPTPVVGLPDVEFIELFNPGTEPYQLENWELVNSTTAKSLPEFALLQNGFVLLCDEDEVEALTPFGDVLGIPSFTALSNGGDSLSLLSPSGIMIDVVSYSDDWYNDPVKAEGGWTMERINPYLNCSSENNWSASVNQNGGTPGVQNSIFEDLPDTIPPVLQSYRINTPTSVTLVFNEPMDLLSLNYGTYLVDNGIGVSFATAASPFLFEVDLQLDQALDTSVTYTFTVENVFDCEGNIIGNENTISFMIGYTPEVHDIVMSEILSDPIPVIGLPEAEFIEIFNRSDRLIDLSNGSLNEAQFPEQVFIEPNSYAILTGEQFLLSFFGLDQVIGLNSWSSSFLTNNGETLKLRNANGDIIDEVHYDISWHSPGKTEGGWTLERINLEEPCRGQNNWSSSISYKGGTPGEVNSISSDQSDVTPPRLLNIYVIEENLIELEFDEVMDSLSLFMASITIDHGMSAFQSQFSNSNYSSVITGLSNNMVPEITYQLIVDGIKDCSGNLIGSSNVGKFGLPQEPEVGDLVINEILFNPIEGGSDFVELYNKSEKIISLEGWNLGNHENGIPGGFETITEKGRLLFPKEFIALSKDTAHITKQYSMAAWKNLLQMESLPSYNNDEGNVLVTLPDLEISDEFYYQEDYHFALLDDVNGVSLERIDVNRVTNDPTNWHSASSQVGFATPGYQNSQFFQTTIPSSSVSVEPEVFSPDNDGFEDFLNINYSFDEPGYVGNITIYNSNGVITRKLVSNELLGTVGTISWDGITDNKEKARIGIYVIFIEIFDLEGHVNHFKETCVLGGKL